MVNLFNTGRFKKWVHLLHTAVRNTWFLASMNTDLLTSTPVLFLYLGLISIASLLGVWVFPRVYSSSLFLCIWPMIRNTVHCSCRWKGSWKCSNFQRPSPLCYIGGYRVQFSSVLVWPDVWGHLEASPFLHVKGHSGFLDVVLCIWDSQRGFTIGLFLWCCLIHLLSPAPFLKRNFFLFWWPKCPCKSHLWNVSLCTKTYLPYYGSKDQGSVYDPLSSACWIYRQVEGTRKSPCIFRFFPISYFLTSSEFFYGPCLFSPSNIPNLHGLIGDWQQI